MTEPPAPAAAHEYCVLFLSQRNAARSIMAEAILNSLGKGRFKACSAGVRPIERVEPVALELLQHAGLPTQNLKPKHFSEFTAPGAQPLDFVFTLSDTAAGEKLPQWPGTPVTAHWPSSDPARVLDDVERRRSLIRVRAELESRLRVFASLPFASLDRLSMAKHVTDIGAG